MNSRLFVSQSQKGNGNDHKADAGNSWGPNFPFSAKIDQVDPEKHKQISSDDESGIPFHF
jgi:hypothetical protein